MLDLEVVNCSLCDKYNAEPFLVQNGYNAVKCKSCGLIYVNPRPTQQQLKLLYETDLTPSVSITACLKARYEKSLEAVKKLRIIRRFKQSGNLLEIGPAAGYFLLSASEAGYNVHGIEINEHFANFSRNELKLDVKCGTILESKLPESYFDIIYMCDVLYHLSEPVEELRKLNKWLKDDGLFVFETGNVGDLTKNQIGKYAGDLGLGLPEHLFHYGEKHIDLLLNKTGFALEKIYRYSVTPQRMFRRIIGKLKSLYVSGLTKPKAKDNVIWGAANSDITIKRRFQAKLNLFLRYSVGKICPKQGRWLTLIVVARKRKSVTKLFFQKEKFHHKK